MILMCFTLRINLLSPSLSTCLISSYVQGNALDISKVNIRAVLQKLMCVSYRGHPFSLFKKGITFIYFIEEWIILNKMQVPNS